MACVVLCCGVLCSKKRVLIEYILLGGVNDSAETAHQLGALLKGRDIVCNLIPYNTVELDNGRQYEAPDAAATKAFAHILRTDYGLMTTVRLRTASHCACFECFDVLNGSSRACTHHSLTHESCLFVGGVLRRVQVRHEMGQEIGGACGQLAINGGKGCSTNDSKAAPTAAAPAPSASTATGSNTAAAAAAPIALVSGTDHTTAVVGITDTTAAAVKSAAAAAVAVVSALEQKRAAPAASAAATQDIEDLGRVIHSNDTTATVVAAASATLGVAAAPVVIPSVIVRNRKEEVVKKTAATIAQRTARAAAAAAKESENAASAASAAESAPSTATKVAKPTKRSSSPATILGWILVVAACAAAVYFAAQRTPASSL
jgi:hypothetical protein